MFSIINITVFLRKRRKAAVNYFAKISNMNDQSSRRGLCGRVIKAKSTESEGSYKTIVVDKYLGTERNSSFDRVIINTKHYTVIIN